MDWVFIEYLINKMSLKDKIGQLLYIDYRKVNEKITSMNSEFEKILSKYKPGGFILFSSNISDYNNTFKFIKDIMDISYIKMFIGVDQEGGRVQRLNSNVGFDSIMPALDITDSDEAYGIGRIIGRGLRGLGINMDMAPVLDVYSNRDNRVIGNRAFGRTKDEVLDKSLAFARGLSDEKIISVGKHFPGHGNTSVDSHIDLPVLDSSREDLDRLELASFKGAINMGIPALMVGHIVVSKIDSYPSSISNMVINGILRDEMKYNGIVMPDSLKMKGLTKYFSFNDIYYNCIMSGNDFVFMPMDIDDAFNTIYRFVNDGKISIERIDDSLRRIFYLKFNSGLLDDEYDCYLNIKKKKKVL